MSEEHLEAMEYRLNEFAIRCFRDTADYDYVAARMAHRADLYPQFLWSGLQAIEKYLKCILLLNRIEAKKVRHSLARGIIRIEERAPFTLRLSTETRELIDYLDMFGRFRYFETMYHYSGDELMKLDRAVWEIRRYCRPLNVSMDRPDGTRQSSLESNLRAIEIAEHQPPQRFRVYGGRLEIITSTKKHPARPALVWKNLFYGSAVRYQVEIRQASGFSNSPLAMRPEIVDEVLKYVFLPKEIVAAFQEGARLRAEHRDGERTDR